MIGQVLALDIGNTSTHWGVFKSHNTILANGDIDRESFAEPQQAFTTLVAEHSGAIRGIACCCVVPELFHELRLAVDQVDSSLELFHLTHEKCPSLGLPLAYPKPSEIGEDRLANGFAAQSRGKLPAVVIDMGTAVTLDVVTSRGYEGGMIAPGISIMTRYLHEQTALLPALDPEELIISGDIGKSTTDAMKLGCVIGFEGMISALCERVVDALQHETHGSVTVYSTGGSARWLPRRWLERSEVVPHMTLYGVVEAYRRWTMAAGKG